MPKLQRREKAEREGVIGISDVRGLLHAHSKEGNESSPESVVETRRGSNCGSIPLEILTA